MVKPSDISEFQFFWTCGTMLVAKLVCVAELVEHSSFRNRGSRGLCPVCGIDFKINYTEQRDKPHQLEHSILVNALVLILSRDLHTARAISNTTSPIL